jgi:hypothetical protein
MKTAVLTGIVGGIVAGILTFFSLTMAGDSEGAILYYSPLLVFLACIYYSVKRTNAEKNNGVISFKDSLKAGGVTSIFLAVLIGIGFFVALTHTDVNGLLHFMMEKNMPKEEIQKTLAGVTKQDMFERAKFWTMPYFLLGFLMTVGVAFVLKRMQVTGKKV